MQQLITQTGRREHITPVLQQLHSLPIWRQVEFKLAVLVYKSFAVAGPRVWNSLLAPLHDSNSIYSFRKQLKTFLFSGGYCA